MSKSSSRGALLALASALLLVQPRLAAAGACCVGSTAPVPTRLGPCERYAAGLGLGAERGTGRWDSAGRVVDSSVQDDALTATVAASYRWNRHGQVGLLLPSRMGRKQVSDQDFRGGGLGDLSLLATFNPMEERPREGRAGIPVPVLSVGARLPTGRSWLESEDPMMADVTGLPDPALLLGLWVERTLDRLPWSLGLDATLGTAAAPRVLGTSLMAGTYLGSRWTLLGTARHERSLGGEAPTRRNRVGARMVHGKTLAWRAWADVGADLPLPGLGLDQGRSLSAGAGLLLLR